jgi:hypothetical protein
MKPDLQISTHRGAIDNILASEDQLVPSSGFVASVMERVREESIAPKPIPFPWKLALPGMVLAAGTIGWLIYEFIRMALSGTLTGGLTSSLTMPQIPAAAQQSLMPAIWIALALVISLASWAFSRRLIRRSSLL